MLLLSLLATVTQPRTLKEQLQDLAIGVESPIKGRPGIGKYIDNVAEVLADLGKEGIKRIDQSVLDKRIAFVVAAEDVKPLAPFRALRAVPMVAMGGDGTMVDYNGKDFPDEYSATMHTGEMGLLAPRERALTRKKFQVVECMAYQFGGFRYGPKRQPQPKPRPFILLHYAAPQFEKAHLEPRDFCDFRQEGGYKPCERYAKHKNEHVYRKIMPVHDIWTVDDVLCASVAEDAYLITKGFQLALERLQKRDGAAFPVHRILRVAGAGLGIFARFWHNDEVVHLGKLFSVLYSASWRLALKRLEGDCPLITHVHFNHWTGPNDISWHGIQVENTTQDILEFLDLEAIYGIVNAGDAFCMPGDEFSVSSSLDSNLLNNSDGRWAVSPIFNQKLTLIENWIFLQTEEQRIKDAIYFSQNPVAPNGLSSPKFVIKQQEG